VGNVFNYGLVDDELCIFFYANLFLKVLPIHKKDDEVIYLFIS